MSAKADTNEPWSISVKTVGSEQRGSGDTVAVERDFVVQVSPDDHLRTLYDQIENATGLKACQQRLIYRGRLIGGADVDKESGDSDDQSHSNELKIKDIVGLNDGHTIHLIRKRDTSADNTGRQGDDELRQGRDTSSAPGSTSLLSALLGMGSSSDDDGDGIQQNRVFRSSRLNSRRRAHYRLSSEDLEIPDPGSMEHVRQGLLTMHTLLPPARTAASRSTLVDMQSPLDLNRKWYIGQWIDCRDTVNQWLEATVVDIMHPDEILTPRESPPVVRQRRVPTIQPVSDPVVGAADFEGRRRLLLEPCSEGDSDDEGGELAGFRRRDNNSDVQLLLIHYNGWPHRWDEWIRSDSERIRPFRVRTRHPATSATALPTPQSHYSESPPTFIRSSNEEEDRMALLPELSHVLDSVNSMLGNVTLTTSRASRHLRRRESGDEPRLPWTASQLTECEEEEDISSEKSEDYAEPEDPILDSRLRRRQLEALAPLLDRLGRTLVDAAPHVAAIAASLPSEPGRSEGSGLTSIEENTSTLSGLLSLLNRDRRRTGISSEETTVVSDEDNGRSSIRDRRRLSSASSNMAVSGSVNDQTNYSGEEIFTIDPDYVDFATGVVNTTRGEVRSGPRNRRGQGDDVAGLLGAYLAAASLASIAGADGGDDNDNVTGLIRLLRDRGNGSGGIDIHIHAIVTSPGNGTGGTVGVLTPIGNASPAVTNNNHTNNSTTSTFGSLFSSSRERRHHASSASPSSSSIQQQDDEDMGIFAELYSETPEPVNPNGLTNEERDSAITSPETNMRRWEQSELSDWMASQNGEHQPRLMSRIRSESSTNSRSSSRTQESDGRRRGSVFSRLFRRTPSGRQ